MNIVFCLPGQTFSGNFLQSWTKMVGFCQGNGINLVLSQRYNSNVYYVRAQCLGANVTDGPNQKPFGGKINYDYIMWIDSDQIFNPTDFSQLLRHDKDIIGGLYYMEDGKQFPVVKDWDEEYFKEHGSFKFLNKEDIQTKKEPFEVVYTGFGFLLIKRGVFETVTYPWFEPQHFDFGGVVDFASEDVSFCKKAKAAGFNIFIDPTVIVGHEKMQILI